MRGFTAVELVDVSVTCWPTIGARSLGKASEKASRSRSWALFVEKSGFSRKFFTVSTLPSCRKPEAAHLVAQVGVVGALPEHADLRVEVAHVRDLELLGLAFEGALAVGTEEALALVELVASVARGDLIRGLVEEDVPPGRLVGVQAVVEGAHRVRGQEDLQDEVRELLHLGGRDRAVLSDQAFEGHDEVAEREVLVAGGARRLVAVVDAEEAVDAIAAPVQGAVGGHAAQGLRRHRALHGVEALRRRRSGPTGLVFWETEPSGSPRFHASPSRSPKMWQLEHEASPLPDEMFAS